MFVLYNVLLTAFVILAFPFLLFKVMTTSKYRRGLGQRCGRLPEQELRKIKGSRPIWIHAVSVGETIAAAPLVRELRSRYPARKILVTTVTETGHLIARAQVKEADAVLFFPFDFGMIVKRVIGLIRPSLFILMETEIWPNCIRSLHGMGVPIVLVNGRISSASYRGYRRIRFLMKRVLPLIQAFSMQTGEDVRKIVSLGAPEDRVRNLGSIKFDRETSPLSDEEKDKKRKEYGLPPDGEILVVGSTHHGEEELLVDAYLRLREEFAGLSLILAPRHPERCDEVEALLRERGVAYQRRSRAQDQEPVLLLDTVGELSGLYGIAAVAFIGGSLVPKGGQNVLEPAVYGVPSVFGPHMENFPEISAVIRERGGGMQIRESQELVPVIGELLRNHEKRHGTGQAGMQVMRENQGALRKNMDLIAGFLGA